MSEVDKDKLYGRYQKHEDWRDNLGKKLSHKALDIPEGEMIDAHRTYNGIGTGGAIAIAAAAGLPMAIIAGVLAYLMFISQPTAAPAPAAAPVPSAGPADSAYDVIFYDADGNRVAVPHISTKPK